jgi:hypothetical protein
MGSVPKIKDVQPIREARLLVAFDNGIKKVYDCSALLGRPPFCLLARSAFFNAVHVDPGGYGISWSDGIDLSEYELRTHGNSAPNSRLG